MADSTNRDNLRDTLDGLKPKNKEPVSKRVLDSWVNKIENTLDGERGGRLAWLVATTVVAAVLQRAVDIDGQSRFLIKGGTMLQHRLGSTSRPTKDLDGMVRGDIDSFLAALDTTLREQWGPLSLKRGEVEAIETPTKIIKPRSFDISISLKGDIWRRIKVEISPEEGSAGQEIAAIKPPSLAGLGLPTPEELTSLAMRFQIAQKVHAATDPHDPPDYVNNRPRDVVDLILIHELISDDGELSNIEIKDAIFDIFAARAAEAKVLGRKVRTWPARVVAWPHWGEDYQSAADAADLTLSLDEAVAEVNEWLDKIDSVHI
jgi:hypothetical protein